MEYKESIIIETEDQEFLLVQVKSKVPKENKSKIDEKSNQKISNDFSADIFDENTDRGKGK